MKKIDMNSLVDSIFTIRKPPNHDGEILFNKNEIRPIVDLIYPRFIKYVNHQLKFLTNRDFSHYLNKNVDKIDKYLCALLSNYRREKKNKKIEEAEFVRIFNYCKNRFMFSYLDFKSTLKEIPIEIANLINLPARISTSKIYHENYKNYLVNVLKMKPDHHSFEKYKIDGFLAHSLGKTEASFREVNSYLCLVYRQFPQFKFF